MADIVRRAGDLTSLEDLRRIAYETFVEWFDADSAGPVNGYDVIAQTIWNWPHPAEHAPAARWTAPR